MPLTRRVFPVLGVLGFSQGCFAFGRGVGYPVPHGNPEYQPSSIRCQQPSSVLHHSGPKADHLRWVGKPRVSAIMLAISEIPHSRSLKFLTSWGQIPVVG